MSTPEEARQIAAALESEATRAAVGVALAWMQAAQAAADAIGAGVPPAAVAGALRGGLEHAMNVAAGPDRALCGARGATTALREMDGSL
jgi:hypothetical protein